MKFNFTLTKKKSKKKNIDNFSYTTIHPARDWYIILITFAVVCFLGIIWSAYLFYLSEQPLDQNITTTQSGEGQGVSAMQKIINDFGDKEKRHNEARRIAPTLGDPSL